MKNYLQSYIFTQKNLLSIIGGVIFLILFLWGYSTIDSHWYEYRDDGVITLSVAKNLVDYGFWGVSPSGPIVEASSSPIQVFLYAITYALWDLKYSTYAYWQTIISTFLLGAIYIRFFSDKVVFALIATTITAFSLTKFFNFFLWHGSGMENAITHLLFLLTVYILYKAIEDKKIYYSLAVILFFATISRLDSVYHIAFILVLFSIYWFIVYKELRALYFSLVVFLLWFSFQLWRYYYFGDLTPNTAYAQHISVFERILKIVSLDRETIRQSLSLAREIFLVQAGWLLLLVPALLYYAKRNYALIFLLLTVLTITLTSYFNPFLFGPTRLDHNRSTTQMIVLVFLLITMLFYALESYKKKIILFVIFTPFTLWYYQHLGYAPKPLCCNTKSFDKTRVKVELLAKKHNIHRATISNPDLGVFSWHKNFNIVDFGRLGSPIMAHIGDDHKLIKQYLLEYALPDIIELHDGYSCGYHFLLEDKKFLELYESAGTKVTNWTKRNCKEAPKSQTGLWIRKDIKKRSLSNERKFLNDLQKKVSVERVVTELRRCEKESSHNCQYISRVVYHMLPEFVEYNLHYQVIEAFKPTKTSLYDIHLLTGRDNAQSYKAVVELLKNKIDRAIPRNRL